MSLSRSCPASLGNGSAADGAETGWYGHAYHLMRFLWNQRDDKRMAGRHQQYKHVANRAVSLPVILGSILAMAVIVATLFVVFRPNSHAESAGTLHQKCAAPVVVRVAVAPVIAQAVTGVADQWMNGSPTVDSRCIQVKVTAEAPDQEERALAHPTSTSPTVWVPDSSVWAQRLEADQAAIAATPTATTVQIHSGIASSPIVIVASPDRAAKMMDAASAKWAAIASAATPIAIADPVVTSEGLLTLLAAQSSPTVAAHATKPDLAAALPQISRAMLPTVADGFNELSAAGVAAPLFTASEQAVIQQNKAKGDLFASAVYPADGTLNLDFPVVRVPPVIADVTMVRAANLFEQQLRTAAAKDRFIALGLRDATGHPVPGVGSQQGVLPADSGQLAKPTNSQVTDTLLLWHAATTDSHTLVVIDVAQSMTDPAPSGESKVQLATAGFQAVLPVLSGRSTVGLWAYSSSQSSNLSYAELVAPGPLADQVGARARRNALVLAAGGLAGRIGGRAGLYDTALAAVHSILASYDPSRVNNVVLISDGQNDYQGGQSLSQVLSKLKSEADPTRPVPLITIGIDSYDPTALRQISAATGGTTYSVASAAGLRSVLLSALVAGDCRPGCK
jgi:Ca-activated chloride channel family protein